MRTLVLSCLALLAAQPPAQEPNHWIYFDSVESESGPWLHVDLADGRELAIPAERDTVLIGYLPDRAWGRLPRLSVDKRDENRTLIYFPVAAGLKVAKAELRATAHPGSLPPLGDTSFRVFRVLSTWDDGTDWNRGPRFAAVELAVAPVPHGGGEIAVEITELVKVWTADPESNQGIALRSLRDEGAPKAAPPPASPHTAGLDLTGRVRACIPWRDSVADALAEAKESGKRVMAFVVADRFQQLVNAHERSLAANVLLEPEVRAFLDAHFVPLRLSTHPVVHLGPEAVDGDPLTPLGADCVEAKAPALVIATSGGEKVAVLSSIGTWDRDLIVGFLRHALPDRESGEDSELSAAAFAGDHEKVIEDGEELRESGAWTAADRVLVARSLLAKGRADRARELLGSDEDLAARYWKGVASARLHERGRAEEHWRAIVDDAEPESPWRLRAELRLLWSDAIEELTPASAVVYRPGRSGTEVARAPLEQPALVGQALDYLLSRQQGDGRWVHPGYSIWDAAVTALCARAIARWLPHVAGERRERVAGALARAEEWCVDYVKNADPVTADSFGTAYLLELFVARAAEVDAVREAVPAAVELLLGGQLDSGAWSYNRRFGQNWRGGFGGWPETDKGRAHSINTGIALWALARAKAAGFAVPAKAVAAGVASLEEMAESPTTFTYTWPEPRTFTKPDQSIGKAAVCLEALVMLEKRPRADLEKALSEFMRWRGGLRATVKLTSSWIGPSGTSSYFFLHACYHAAEAIAFCGGDERQARLRALRDDLLAVAEVDGTWVDYEESGKTYGTAMALLVLARAR